jgi:hypothetical protein
MSEGEYLPSIFIEPTLPSKDESELPSLLLSSNKVVVRRVGLDLRVVIDLGNHAFLLQHFQQVSYLLWRLA